MDLPASLTAFLLVLLGYCLARVSDFLGRHWHHQQSPGAGAQPGDPSRRDPAGHQRQEERRRVYASFRLHVTEVVNTAVTDGHGSYGMLYRIRDAYSDLLRGAPPSVAEAADSIIRCVTLLVNLGPSDARYAMFTRALHHFDEACSAVAGGEPVTPSSGQEFPVTAPPVNLKELQPRR